MIMHANSSGSRREFRVNSLNQPPTCPINGCDKTIDPEKLPTHIIENHDGTLV